jgi:hypothetical protein
MNLKLKMMEKLVVKGERLFVENTPSEPFEVIDSLFEKCDLVFENQIVLHLFFEIDFNRIIINFHRPNFFNSS